MGNQVDDTGPHWLDGDEQEQWNALAYMLSLLPAALEAQMQRDAGVSLFDYTVMSALSAAPGRTLRMSVLANYTGSTLSRLSNVAGRLEKRGWISRHADPGDARCTLGTLTDAGMHKVEAAAPAHVQEVRRLVFDPLTKGQQRQLGTAARRIVAALAEASPP